MSAVLHDPRVSADRMEQFATHQLRGLDLRIVADYLRVANRGMLMKDIPLHARLRRIASESFTKSALDIWRPIVQKVAEELLDRVQTMGRMDLVADFAQPLPAIVIAEMFDCPGDRGLPARSTTSPSFLVEPLATSKRTPIGPMTQSSSWNSIFSI
jgi:cytochrome P450 PksS